MKYPKISTKGVKSMDRPSWDEYWMAIAQFAKSRSTCISRQVGAVIVKDNHLLSTGYNGAPKGIKHCDEVGCLRKQKNVASGERHELCRGTHAEENAILQCAVHGSSTKGATLYSTHHPCSMCVKSIINAQIDKVIYKIGYPDDLAENLIQESDVEIVKIDGHHSKKDVKKGDKDD